MRQLIIARKDLNMSAGKLAAQCCHASMAFLTFPLKQKYEEEGLVEYQKNNKKFLTTMLEFPKDIFTNWLCGTFTKTICEAKTKTQLLKAITIAEDLGLKENQDFWLIKDCCLTELTPEEFDFEGIGRVLTCIGFRPLPDEIAHKISKKYQLYK